MKHQGWIFLAHNKQQNKKLVSSEWGTCDIVFETKM